MSDIGEEEKNKHSSIEIVKREDGWPDKVTFNGMEVSYKAMAVIQNSDRTFSNNVDKNQQIKAAYTACVDNDYEKFRTKSSNEVDPKTVWQATVLIAQHHQLAVMNYKYVKVIIELSKSNDLERRIDIDEEKEETLLKKARRELFVASHTVERSHFHNIRNMKHEILDLLRTYENYTFRDDDDDEDSIDSNVPIDRGYVSDGTEVEEAEVKVASVAKKSASVEDIAMEAGGGVALAEKDIAEETDEVEAVAIEMVAKKADVKGDTEKVA